MLKKFILLVAIVFTAQGFAADNVSANDYAKLKIKLTNKIKLNVDKIIETPLTDIVLVVTDGGMFYASTDGNFIIEGKVYDFTGEAVVDIADSAMSEMRVAGLERFKNDVIEYPAKDEKYVINVFTDITCGYCRQMHAKMQEYNDLGITVRYLAFPRGGIYDKNGGFSNGFKNLRSIWCNENPAQAMTAAKNGAQVEARICEAPVKEEFEFAQKIGVNATPTIILENGQVIPGYRKPNELIQMLRSTKG